MLMLRHTGRQPIQAEGRVVQWLLIFPIRIHDPQAKFCVFRQGEFVGPVLVSRGDKDDVLAIGRPDRQPVPVPVVGEWALVAAVGIHQVHLPVSAVVGHVGDLFAIWRDGWRGIVLELGQLRCSDVIERGGVHCLNITEEAGPLKNEGSERLIPIHPEIMRLGFIEFVEKMSSAGSDRLFPELFRVKIPPSDKIGRWFNRTYMTKCGLRPSDRKISFHSFRHTFIHACKVLKIPEALAGQMQLQLFHGQCMRHTAINEYLRSSMRV